MFGQAFRAGADLRDLFAPIRRDGWMKGNIPDMVASGESEELEFKVSFGREVIETPCVFAWGRISPAHVWWRNM